MEGTTLLAPLRALAHRSRYLVLSALAAGELNVKEIERLSGVTQPALSQHLAALREAALAETRKEGRMIYHRLVPERLSAVIAAVTQLLPESAVNEAAVTRAGSGCQPCGVTMARLI